MQFKRLYIGKVTEMTKYNVVKILQQKREKKTLEKTIKEATFQALLERSAKINKFKKRKRYYSAHGDPLKQRGAKAKKHNSNTFCTFYS